MIDNPAPAPSRRRCRAERQQRIDVNRIPPPGFEQDEEKKTPLYNQVRNQRQKSVAGISVTDRLLFHRQVIQNSSGIPFEKPAGMPRIPAGQNHLTQNDRATAVIIE